MAHSFYSDCYRYEDDLDSELSEDMIQCSLVGMIAYMSYLPMP